MNEIDIIHCLLCSICNKPPKSAFVYHNANRQEFIVDAICCANRQIILPFLDNSVLGLAVHYAALSNCCMYIVGMGSAPSQAEWEITGRIFDNAFGSADTQSKQCDCGAVTAGSPAHAEWCSTNN